MTAAADIIKRGEARAAQTERDAVLLFCSDHAFTRWREATESERDKYRRKARRLSEHLSTYEGLA